MKIKILFFIHDVGHGGAEKVLVNLVNNMDSEKYDITVISLFKGGINEQFLKGNIKFKTIFPKMIPGNSRIMKIFSPRFLHNLFIKDNYDVEVAYLEGPDSRIISGCPNKQTKKIYWIHCTMHNKKEFAGSFRSFKEAIDCYSRFDAGAFVSSEVKNAFEKYCMCEQKRTVLYNTNDTDLIIEKSKEMLLEKNEGIFQIIAVGKIEPVKGFYRLAKIHKRLIQEGYKIRTIILGEGRQKNQIERYINDNHLAETFLFLGYQTNPYKYIAQSDLFVCSSYSEGFSTAATEALIVGTPVITTHVSGMKEMLGEKSEYGLITENSDKALYIGIKKFLDNRQLYEFYKDKARIRGNYFKKDNTVKAVEDFILTLL